MSKKTLYAFVVSFILLICVIILNRVTFNNMRRFTKQVDHTREVITLLESISDAFKSAQIYTPTYANIPQSKFYVLYKKDADELNEKIVQLKQLISDNSYQIRIADSIQSLISSQWDVLEKKNVAEIITSGESWRLNTFYKVDSLIDAGIVHEKELLMARSDRLAHSTHLTNLLTTIFAVIAVGIILITFLSHLFLSQKRRWLEGFLESILNTSQNGIVYLKSIREHGRIIDFKTEYLNNAIEGLLNIKPSTIIGKKLSEVAPHNMRSGMFEKYVEVVETGKPIEFEIFYNANGLERWFYIMLAKMEDGVTATFHNITQLKKYEQELKEKIGELERSNSELEQYAYVASHDLQEPLRKIRSFGSFLQETQAHKLDEKGQQQLSKIMSSAERMSLLIKDILSFSSIKKQEQFVPTDLNNVLQAVIMDLDLMISQKKATIHIDPLPVVDAIPLQMNQLFYNLINNSLKFARENVVPEINIHCRELKEDEVKVMGLKGKGNYFDIDFSDNGIGFNQEYAEQIFGMFKRLNDKQYYPGSGIGLSLCRKVVLNHNGMIKAFGEEGKGAMFRIVLPEKQEH